ncbi:fungal-specific transcription factor domain-containing protein [Aspergillus heterothallicus]
MQPAKRQRTSIGNQGDGPFSCQSCEKTFSRIENLTRHAENHKPSARFACEVCAKRFNRSDVLKRHLKLHRGSEGQQSVTNTDQSPTPQSLVVNSETQPYRVPENVTPANCNRIQAGESGTRHHEQHCTTALSGGYDSPLSHLSYPSLSEGNYGVYGEGSFDADLAWILDMAPPDYMAVPMRQSEDTTQTNMQPIPSMALETDGGQIESDALHHVSTEERNTWPDVDGLPGGRGMQELSTLSVPDSESWVDHAELSSIQALPNEGRAQCYTVDRNIRARLIATLEEQSSVKDGLLPPEAAKFPNEATMEYFIRLFFKHVHLRFPVIHRPTFSTETAPPFLLLSMMLLGSSHSPSNRGRFVAAYLWPVVTMFSRIQVLDTAYLRETDNILTLLFLCVSAAWCGHKFAFEFAEGARGILVTACRRSRLLDCRLRPSADGETARSMRGRIHQAWEFWTRSEQRKRLGLSIHMFDLQFPALFHNQPYISKAETVNLVLPCHESFWEAKSAAAWKVLLGPAETPPSTYFMVPLDTCLLYPATKREPPYAPIDSLGKTILMYALFTHIFDWRQTMNLVVHSAFIRGPEGTGPGEGLMERQRWLRDGLDAWFSAYHRIGDSAPDAALLLHLLAEIHLDINVSDLHLFAGRSGLDEDIKLAEDSLRRWCQSPDSARTMHNVYQMLDLAYRVIEMGNERQCGFEISVALFTGGLTCWIYAKLGGQVPLEFQINLASDALEKLSCWGICYNFAQILRRFKE